MIYIMNISINLFSNSILVEGEGFEPSKAEPTDLQSAPVDRLGTPPKKFKPAILKESITTVNSCIFNNLAGSNNLTG